MANFDIIYRIATDLTGLNKGVQDTAKATEQIDQKMTSLQSSVKGAGAALVAAFGAAAIGNEILNLGRQVIELGSHLTDLRAKTGISLEGLQVMKVVAEQNGVSLETLATATNKLGVNIAGASKGVKEAADKLGLSFETLRKQSPEDNLSSVAKAFSSIENPAEKAKLAMELFGKSGLELLPILTKEFSEQTEAAKRLGIVMSDDVVEAADKFDDQMVVVKATMIKFAADVLTPLLPGLLELQKMFLGLAAGALGLGKSVVDNVIWAFLKAKSVILDWSLALNEAVAKHPLLAKALGSKLKTPRLPQKITRLQSRRHCRSLETTLKSPGSLQKN